MLYILIGLSLISGAGFFYFRWRIKSLKESLACQEKLTEKYKKSLEEFDKYISSMHEVIKGAENDKNKNIDDIINGYNNLQQLLQGADQADS